MCVAVRRDRVARISSRDIPQKRRRTCATCAKMRFYSLIIGNHMVYRGVPTSSATATVYANRIHAEVHLIVRGERDSRKRKGKCADRIESTKSSFSNGSRRKYLLQFVRVPRKFHSARLRGSSPLPLSPPAFIRM